MQKAFYWDVQTAAGLKPLFKLGLAGFNQPRASGRFTSSTSFVYWESFALLSCSTASLLHQWRAFWRSAGWGCVLCAGTGIPSTPFQHPLHPETPTSPSVSAPNEPKMSFVPQHPRGPGSSQKKKNHCSHFHHQSQPWGVPSPLIPVTPSPPMDAAPTPRSVSKENQPLVVSPPLLPLQAVFLLLSSFHQAANMLSEQ